MDIVIKKDIIKIRQQRHFQDNISGGVWGRSPKKWFRPRPSDSQMRGDVRWTIYDVLDKPGRSSFKKWGARPPYPPLGTPLHDMQNL